MSIQATAQGLEHKTFRQDPVPETRLCYLRRYFPEGRYHGVDEAGYSGFWIYDALTAAGIDMMVINLSDVPTTDRKRSFKLEPVDARKLVRSLRSGGLRPIYVPNHEAVQDRQLVRMRGRLISKQTPSRIRSRHSCTNSVFHTPVSLHDGTGRRNPLRPSRGASAHRRSPWPLYRIPWVVAFGKRSDHNIGGTAS